MELPDFANLSLVSIVGLAVLLATFDVIGSISIAIAAGNFSPTYVGDFLRTHVLLRIMPILLLGAAGNGIPAFGIPPIATASVAASAALAAYAIEVLGSIRGSWKDRSVAPG